MIARCSFFVNSVLLKCERDERYFDFHKIGASIKKAREARGMTQGELAYVIDRGPRTIMYNENDDQHPSFNTFYQMVTMFGISVDEFFYPNMTADIACRKRIEILLNSSAYFPAGRFFVPPDSPSHGSA